MASLVQKERELEEALEEALEVAPEAVDACPDAVIVPAGRNEVGRDQCVSKVAARLKSDPSSTNTLALAPALAAGEMAHTGWTGKKAMD